MDSDKKSSSSSKKSRQLSLLAEVASLYYEKELTQAEIADRLFISRTSISRLLKQAKEKGVVEIKVNYTYERNYNLEKRIKDRFKLTEVLLLNSHGKTQNEIIHGIGALAADYLKKRITEKMVIGVSWGSTVSEAINSIYVDKKIPIDVVQIMGAFASDSSNIDAQEIIRILARIYSGKAHYLHAPLLIEEDYVRTKLLFDPIISNTMELAQNADLILTGIGSLDSVKNMNPWLGYMNKETYTELINQGAVGSICAHFFDINGNEIDSNWNKQLIGINLNNLRKINEVIAAASGLEKVQAIIGGIKGQYINVLITDEITANAIFDQI